MLLGGMLSVFWEYSYVQSMKAEDGLDLIVLPQW